MIKKFILLFIPIYLLTACHGKQPTTLNEPENIQTPPSSSESVIQDQSTLPSEEPVNTDLTLTEEKITRLWHGSQGVGSSYSTRYLFQKNGTFIYAASLVVEAERLRYSAGNWWIDEGVLCLSANRVLYHEGGVAVGGAASSINSIVGGQLEYRVIPEELQITERYDVTLRQEDGWDCMKLGNEQLWASGGIILEDMHNFQNGVDFWSGVNEYLAGQIGLANELQAMQEYLSAVPWTGIVDTPVTSGDDIGILYTKEEHQLLADYLSHIFVTQNKYTVEVSDDLNFFDKYYIALHSTAPYIPGRNTDPQLLQYFEKGYFSPPDFLDHNGYHPILFAHVQETYEFLFDETLKETYGSYYGFGDIGQPGVPLCMAVVVSGGKSDDGFYHVSFRLVDYLWEDGKAVFLVDGEPSTPKAALDQCFAGTRQYYAMLQEVEGRLVLMGYHEIFMYDINELTQLPEWDEAVGTYVVK